MRFPIAVVVAEKEREEKKKKEKVSIGRSKEGRRKIRVAVGKKFGL